MLIELRTNIFLGSEEEINAELPERLKSRGINRIIIVADDLEKNLKGNKDFSVFLCPLRKDRMNPTHIKDLACHCPKLMVQNGDKVLVLGKTGLERGAYITARMICEIEGKSIYDVFLEMQPLVEGLDIGKAYF